MGPAQVSSLQTMFDVEIELESPFQRSSPAGGDHQREEGGADWRGGKGPLLSF